MRNNILIIIVALLLVLMCLVLPELLVCSLTPKFLVIISSIIGFLAGVFITILIQAIIKNIRVKRSKNPA